jgi:phosphatidylinositol dimannoside acyltransferase
VQTEVAPVSPERSPGPHALAAALAGRRPSALRRLRAALRFDGLWWRKFARLGSVYGPEWWTHSSPPVVALIIFLLVGRNRRGSIENQARARPGAGRWSVVVGAYRMFACFACCMAETMEYYGPHPKPFRFDEPARNHVEEALARGRGVILATAHVGNWDVSGRRALHKTGRPVHLVMSREPNETTQEYSRLTREHAGMHVIFSDSSVFSAFNMIRALRKNEILAIQIDRGNGEPNSSVKRVEFFDAETPFQEGPFQLARLSGAPVVPVVTLRRGRRHYEVVLGEPRWVDRDVVGDAERALRETVGFFERTIREHPEQWFRFTPLRAPSGCE